MSTNLHVHRSARRPPSPKRSTSTYLDSDKASQAGLGQLESIERRCRHQRKLAIEEGVNAPVSVGGHGTCRAAGAGLRLKLVVGNVLARSVGGVSSSAGGSRWFHAWRCGFLRWGELVFRLLARPHYARVV